MDETPAIVVEGLQKEYRIYPSSFARLKEIASLGKRKFHKPYHALKGVDLVVPPGRSLGVIGENGAGKSTLLKILAGTTVPTAGTFSINGTVASLLELGTGFHSDFTGRNNIYLAAQVQGFKLAEIEAKLDSIIEFTELGEFIDRPIRTYSSGMVMRLGFSVATAINPDVLIIDEILAVGDLYFQKKCIDRIFEFRDAGKSILFCSHSLYDVRQICDEVIWIKDGSVEMQGPPEDVTVAYANYERKLSADPGALTAGREQVQGEGLPAVLATHLLVDDGSNDGRGSPAGDKLMTGASLAWELDFIVRDPAHVVHLGVAIFRSDNVLVASFSTIETQVSATYKTGMHRMRIRLPELKLLEGEYNLVGYLVDQTGVHFYDHRQHDKPLMIHQEFNQPGVVRLDHEWVVEQIVPLEG
ncbi:MAG: ABC transporter ATP-binding protein [Planctomycetota bacterium]|nr:MAG: ABC transporter ATP-binding protein [Planctomycetota bacterium]